MLLRRLMLHVRKENWFAVFLDLAVVIIGLFIGLQVDTWWQAVKESRLEGEYLTEFHEDFLENRSELAATTARLEQLVQSMLVLHEQTALPEPTLSVSALNESFREVFQMPSFIPVDRAFANLTGSGDLKLISSRPLKNALAEYYAAARVTELVQQTHEMELVQIYEPYAIANLDYSAVALGRIGDFPLPPPMDPDSILEVVSTRHFRNILTQKWMIATDLLNQHRQMLKRTEAILNMLDTADGDGGQAAE